MSTRSSDSIDSPIVVPVQPAVVIPPEVHETAARLGVSQYLSQVINLTREIFGSFLRVSVSEDPEFGDTHIIFHVPANCTADEERDFEEQLDKESAWGRRLMEIIPRCPRVYLIFAEFPS